MTQGKKKEKQTGDTDSTGSRGNETDVNGNLISFFERLKTFSSIKRFGTLPMIQNESVAAHSYNVAMLALMIADYEDSPRIHIESVLRKALFHDFEETILSDIPHSIKHRYKGGRLAKLLKEIVPDLIDEEIFKELPDNLKGNYTKHAKEAKLALEGRVVEAADAMDTILTAIRELNLGNRYFERVFEASVQLAQKHDDFKFVHIFLQKAMAYREDIHGPHGEDI